MKFSVRKIMSITATALVLLSVILLFIVLSNNKKIQVVFLDVGQGDAIFITTVTGRQILIDGGKYPDLDTKLARHIPFYDRSIDVVVATHPDLDHIGGLHSVISNYKVDSFMHSGLLAGIPSYQDLANKIIQSDIDITTASSGQTIVLDQYTVIEILAPYPGIDSHDANEYSVTLRLIYGNNSLLLTGDASLINETDLVSFYGSKLESNILKLGHHGSKTASSSLFLKAVQPEYAIVSAACKNSFGHPHVDVVKRVEGLGISIHETCDGDVVFEGDGVSWEMSP